MALNDPRYQQYAAQQKQQTQVQTSRPVPMEQRLQQEQQQFRQDVNTAHTQAGRPAPFQQQQPASPQPAAQPQQPVQQQQPATPQQPQNLIEAKRQEYIQRMEARKAAEAQQQKPNQQQAQQQKPNVQQTQQQKPNMQQAQQQKPNQQQAQQPKREVNRVYTPEEVAAQKRQQQIQDAQNQMRADASRIQTTSMNTGVKPVTGGLGGTVSQAQQRPQQAVTNTPQMSPIGAPQQIQTTTGTVNAQGNNKQGFGTTGGLNSNVNTWNPSMSQPYPTQPQQPSQGFQNLRNTIADRKQRQK